jgi:chaperonin GroES
LRLVVLPFCSKNRCERSGIGHFPRKWRDKKIEFIVKVGDKVLISKYGGTEIKIDGENYLIMREDDILGIIG